MVTHFLVSCMSPGGIDARRQTARSRRIRRIRKPALGCVATAGTRPTIRRQGSERRHDRCVLADRAPIVEQEQKGSKRASYGEELVAKLARDLTARYGRGFSRTNVFQMRQFFLAYREKIQTPSEFSAPESIIQTQSGLFASQSALPLSWSHYVRLLTAPEAQARNYYESESLRGGWSVRELDRQITSQAYERLPQRTSTTSAPFSPSY